MEEIKIIPMYYIGRSKIEKGKGFKLTFYDFYEKKQCFFIPENSEDGQFLMLPDSECFDSEKEAIDSLKYQNKNTITMYEKWIEDYQEKINKIRKDNTL